MPRISSDEAGHVWVSVPRRKQSHDAIGQQPHAEAHKAGMAETRALFESAAGEVWSQPKELLGYHMIKKEMKHETYSYAEGQAKDILEQRKLRTQLQGMTRNECNKGHEEEPNSEGQTADQLEAQMWSW